MDYSEAAKPSHPRQTVERQHSGVYKLERKISLKMNMLSISFLDNSGNLD
jgi:hypothetical protein